jgi:hypothetical protein
LSNNNKKEIMAVLLGLRTYREFRKVSKWSCNIVIRIKSDNSTTTSCLNKLYSRLKFLLSVVREI